MGDFNNNDDWSNRNWQDAGKFGGANNQSGGFFGNNQSGGFFGNNGNNNQDNNRQSLFGGFGGNGGGSGKIGGGWMQGRNSMFVIIVVLIIIIIYTLYSQFSLNASITKSTVERVKIESAFDSKTDPVYFDEYGAVDDDKAMRNAAKDFHAKTGVIPYVYFVTSTLETSDEELSKQADEFYKENFDDENHFIIFFDGLQPGYYLGTSIGENAKTVMDAEAVQIFKDFLSKYYEARQTNNQTYMVNTLRYTAERVMSTLPYSKNSLIFSIIVIAILIVVIVVWIFRRNKEQSDQDKTIEKKY